MAIGILDTGPGKLTMERDPRESARRVGVAFDGSNIWVTNFASNDVSKLIPF